MNVQARIVSTDDKEQYSWQSYGVTTHERAAKSHAKRFPFCYSIIETRLEGREPIFRHEVTKVIDYAVKNLRGDG